MNLDKKSYRGTRDFFPEDFSIREYLFSHMHNTAQQFGYQGYDGPLLEPVELYQAKSGEELINDQIYSFTDRGDRFVAIRPEMTPTLARMVAQVYREYPKPLRWYAIPNLMRYEKPQKGRLREHWQFNCDIFGAPENLGEREIIELAVSLLQSFGANDSHFALLLNDRRIVDGLIQKSLDVDSQTSLKIYKIIDRAKKISAKDLENDLLKILSEEKTNIILEYLALSDFNALKNFTQKHQLEEQAQAFLFFVSKTEKTFLKPYLQYDPSIVRGLDYYTGLVFEIFDKHPENKRAICGGGSYANLLGIFNEGPLAGVGFGLGDVTLLDFLKVHNLLPTIKASHSQILISYAKENCEENALQLAHALRVQNLKAEVMLGEQKNKKAFTYSEKNSIPFVLLFDENEEISIRNMQSKINQNFKQSDIDLMISFIKGSV